MLHSCSHFCKADKDIFWSFIECTWKDILENDYVLEKGLSYGLWCGKDYNYRMDPSPERYVKHVRDAMIWSNMLWAHKVEWRDLKYQEFCAAREAACMCMNKRLSYDMIKIVFRFL